MKTTTELPERLRRSLEDELEPGESILWAGMPDSPFLTARARAKLIDRSPLIAFAFLFLAAAISSTFAKVSPEPMWILVVIGGVALAVAASLLRFLVWSRADGRDRRVVYAVTDRRAIMLELRRKPIRLIYEPDELRSISRRDYPDGRGDVVLDLGAPCYSFTNPRTAERGFLNVVDAKEAERAIRRIAPLDV